MIRCFWSWASAARSSSGSSRRRSWPRSHRVCVYDNRGVGRSDKPAGPYDVRTLADDAVAVMDACGFGRAHVVGLSMGGMIAQELAIRHSDRVGALVLAATYAKPDDNVKATAATTGFDPKSIDPRQLFKLMMGMVLTPEFIARERDWLRATRDRVLANVSVEGFVAQLAATMAHDATSELARITAPTLVMKPTADQLIPPSACGRAGASGARRDPRHLRARLARLQRRARRRVQPRGARLPGRPSARR